MFSHVAREPGAHQPISTETMCRSIETKGA